MTVQRLIVIADAHLANHPSADPARSDQEALLDFLQMVPTLGDSLLLAGDIYDFWFSYRHLIPRRNFPVTAALAHLSRTMPVMMIGGNHDRWGGTFWSEETGIHFDPHELRFDLGDKKILAIHGDGLHEIHTSDRWLNRMIRSSFLIGTFRQIHPDLGFRIGQTLGHDGNEPHSAEHQAAAAARQLAWAEHTFATDASLRSIIMGHTHVAACAEIEPGRWYLNPGAWLKEHRYGILDASGAQLMHFS